MANVDNRKDNTGNVTIEPSSFLFVCYSSLNNFSVTRLASIVHSSFTDEHCPLSVDQLMLTIKSIMQEILQLSHHLFSSTLNNSSVTRLASIVLFVQCSVKNFYYQAITNCACLLFILEQNNIL